MAKTYFKREIHNTKHFFLVKLRNYLRGQGLTSELRDVFATDSESTINVAHGAKWMTTSL